MTKSIFLFFALLSAPFLANAQSAPDHHHPAGPTLKLDEGKKWKTDGTLRAGMVKLQALVLKDLEKIRENKFSPASYAKLSRKVSDQVTQVFKDCKHNPGADEMLHIVLLKIVKSSDRLKEGAIAHRREAALEIAKELNEYGIFFDHPGWQSIEL